MNYKICQKTCSICNNSPLTSKIDVVLSADLTTARLKGVRSISISTMGAVDINACPHSDLPTYGPGTEDLMTQ